MAPVWSGIPSESEPLHAQHTPATPHPQERRNGLSTGLQRPKQMSIAEGARTCYSSPRAIVHSNSTSTYYTYRTCIYSKVHTCMYYITVIVHACDMAILHARTTTVPIPKLSNRERWNPKAACHKKGRPKREPGSDLNTPPEA